MAWRCNSVDSSAAAVCLLTAVLLLSGCGSSRWTAPPTDDPALQAAIARWDACVARTTSAGLQPAALDPTRCEGYRRDVAHHYPAHLDGRVRTELQDHERQRWLQRLSSNYSPNLESEFSR